MCLSLSLRVLLMLSFMLTYSRKKWMEGGADFFKWPWGLCSSISEWGTQWMCSMKWPNKFHFFFLPCYIYFCWGASSHSYSKRLMQQLKVRDKMKIEFSSFSVQGNINYNDTAATVSIFLFFFKGRWNYIWTNLWKQMSLSVKNLARPKLQFIHTLL